MKPDLKTRAAWLRGVATRLPDAEAANILQGYAADMERKAMDVAAQRKRAAGRWA